MITCILTCVLYHKYQTSKNQKYITLLCFFYSEISEISWDKLNIPLELIRLSTELVKKIPSKLTYKHWNFILISIILWPHSVTNSEQNINNFKVRI